MAAADITGKILPAAVARLAMHGKPTSDYRTKDGIGGTFGGATWTVTFVYTKATDTLTVDYAST